MDRLDKLKERIRKEASEKPEKFFPVQAIKNYGFNRDKCKKCGKYFWSLDERNVCGDTECVGGYSFINDSPTDKKFDYVSAWKEFSRFMEERGYEPINRYPVAARWRDDTEFVRASIYDFQPYVVSGEVDPPANPLVVPQFCLRFNDIDNVGITGSHYTGFVMVGQHAFTSPKDYKQDRYFRDMMDWLIEGMNIPKEKIVLHEDSWGGGGNLGACMEFFVDGLELFNQVYITQKIDDSERGYSELETKVLDMGLGHERIVWITHGSETSYEANMPHVIERLRERTGVVPKKEVWKEFLPYSGLLNYDEVEDVDEVWKQIAERIDVDERKLKKEIEPSAALYSVADHTRSLLVAFVDGMLPSNTGEKHSLRVIARRALDFIDRYDWDLSLAEVMDWHAEELEGIFPELKESLDDAKRIIRHEEKKYRETRKKAERIVDKLNSEDLDEERMLELYDTHGISPELLKRMGLDVEQPQDFYAKVSERHEAEKEEESQEDGFELKDLPDTKRLYWEDEKKTEFEAEVLEIIESKGKKYVVLDQTCFYPTQGGQMNDKGMIDGSEVFDTIKQGGIILHLVEEVSFRKGEKVRGEIDWKRRKQLMQHHSATHLINGAARKVLGDHVWQAGAKKTTKKGRLDITHFKQLSKEEIEEIEKKANEMIEQGLDVEKNIMKKSEAEREHGFRIYQGGVPPGNELRIIKIGNDVEACGGTHVDNTLEIESLVLTNTTKVQDGVIRLEFKSGRAAEQYRKMREETEGELEKWIDTQDYTLEEIAGIFDVDLEELTKVVKRFVQEWEEKKKKIDSLQEYLGFSQREFASRPADPKKLFKQWKKENKEIERLEEKIGKEIEERVLEQNKEFTREEVPIENVGTLISAAKKITNKEENKAVLLRGENAVIAARGKKSDWDLRSEVEKEAKVVKGNESLFKGFNLK
ncbi:MAG: alanine--tRNA ligase [Candidatus Aenigmatarchaeota archaeon]